MELCFNALISWPEQYYVVWELFAALSSQIATACNYHSSDDRFSSFKTRQVFLTLRQFDKMIGSVVCGFSLFSWLTCIPHFSSLALMHSVIVLNLPRVLFSPQVQSREDTCEREVICARPLCIFHSQRGINCGEIETVSLLIWRPFSGACTSGWRGVVGSSLCVFFQFYHRKCFAYLTALVTTEVRRTLRKIPHLFD